MKYNKQIVIAAAILLTTVSVSVVYGVTAPKTPRHVLRWDASDGATAYRVTLYKGASNRCTGCHVSRIERVTSPEVDLGSVCDQRYTAVEICSLGPDNKTGGCIFEQIIYEH